MRVISYPGSASGTVRQFARALRVDLVYVTDVEDAMREDFDAVLLLGGADLHPIYYGELVSFARPGDRRRDGVEWVLARQAFTRSLPIMGICRGHQMLAVAAGGSLYQDMLEEGATRRYDDYHKLTGLQGPLRAHLPDHWVNSYHHQAVKRVPDGYRVLAKSPDGLVEAIWRPGALGVQFHPEMMYPEDSAWLSLFEWLVDGLR